MKHIQNIMCFIKDKSFQDLSDNPCKVILKTLCKVDNFSQINNFNNQIWPEKFILKALARRFFQQEDPCPKINLC